MHQMLEGKKKKTVKKIYILHFSIAFLTIHQSSQSSRRRNIRPLKLGLIATPINAAPKVCQNLVICLLHMLKTCNNLSDYFEVSKNVF